MRFMVRVLASIPIVLQILWLGYLAYALAWRLSCTERYEGCYWAGVVLWSWLKVGAIIAPFTIAGIGMLILIQTKRVLSR